MTVWYQPSFAFQDQVAQPTTQAPRDKFGGWGSEICCKWNDINIWNISQIYDRNLSVTPTQQWKIKMAVLRCRAVQTGTHKTAIFILTLWEPQVITVENFDINVGPKKSYFPATAEHSFMLIESAPFCLLLSLLLLQENVQQRSYKTGTWDSLQLHHLLPAEINHYLIYIWAHTWRVQCRLWTAN